MASVFLFERYCLNNFFLFLGTESLQICSLHGETDADEHLHNKMIL